VQVTAAHTRRFDLEHHVAGTRRGVGEVAEFELAVTDKNDAFHAILPRAFWLDARWLGMRQTPAYHATSAVNSKTVGALGLAVPLPLVGRADEVIE
jgi:hypothetical protein